MWEDRVYSWPHLSISSTYRKTPKKILVKTECGAPNFVVYYSVMERICIFLFLSGNVRECRGEMLHTSLEAVVLLFIFLCYEEGSLGVDIRK